MNVADKDVRVGGDSEQFVCYALTSGRGFQMWNHLPDKESNMVFRLGAHIATADIGGTANPRKDSISR